MRSRYVEGVLTHNKEGLDRVKFLEECIDLIKSFINRPNLVCSKPKAVSLIRSYKEEIEEIITGVMRSGNDPYTDYNLGELYESLNNDIN